MDHKKIKCILMGLTEALHKRLLIISYLLSAENSRHMTFLIFANTEIGLCSHKNCWTKRESILIV